MSWKETLKAGDQFGRTNQTPRWRFTVVVPWDGKKLRAYREDIGFISLTADDLLPCVPDYIGNTRRHLAAVLDACNSSASLCRRLLAHLQDPGCADNSPDEEAEEIIPEDWDPTE